jgi:hypothetical protein
MTPFKPGREPEFLALAEMGGAALEARTGFTRLHVVSCILICVRNPGVFRVGVVSSIPAFGVWNRYKRNSSVNASDCGWGIRYIKRNEGLGKRYGALSSEH